MNSLVSKFGSNSKKNSVGETTGLQYHIRFMHLLALVTVLDWFGKIHTNHTEGRVTLGSFSR